MGWTKRQLLEAAFDELGIASYVFDLQPEQLQAALRKMDILAAEWSTSGLRIGYPLPGAPDLSDLDAVTGVPDGAVAALVLWTAIRLAPSYGKQVSPFTMANARNALEDVTAIAAAPVEMDFPQTLPIGAGNKQFNQWWSPFVRPPVTQVLAGGDGAIDLE